MFKEAQYVGEFEIKSGIMGVGDPGYDNCNVIEGVKQGTWKAYVIRPEHERSRIGTLLAVADRSVLSKHWDDSWPGWDFEADLPVDSGQMGIYDKDSFQDDSLVKQEPKFGLLNGEIKPGDRWYCMCCDASLSDNRVDTIPFGVVSASGYGDGVYPCYVIRKGKGETSKIVAVAIEFIPFRDEEEEICPNCGEFLEDCCCDEEEEE